MAAKPTYAELAERLKALKQAQCRSSRQFLRHAYGPTLDALPANIAILARDGRIILVNEAWRRFAEQNGVSAQAVSEGVNYLQVCDRAAGKYSREAKSFGSGIRAVLGASTEAHVETYPCHSPRHKRWFVGSVAPFPGDRERLALVVHVNITALKKAEQALQRSNKTLERRVAERTRLAETRSRRMHSLAVELIEAEERERRRIADVLHDDFQQLLAGARLLLQSVSEGLPQEPDLLEVERMLADCIAKSRALSHELNPAVLHHSGLSAAVQWLAAQMRDQFGLVVRLEIKKTVAVEDTPLKVFLFRAIQELLFNVVKHAGVNTAQVELVAARGELTVAVSDTGRGFDPSILERADSRIGLGLLSLRERAGSLGGRLIIDSATGQGCRCRLSVPLTITRIEAHRPAAGTPPRIPALSRGTPPGETIRVILADDHQVMRRGLIKLISGQPDIRVVAEAANGREALDLAHRLRPDVVIMDIAMPEMDGIAATRAIKRELPGIRVIGLSMFHDDQVMDTLSEAGADAFVPKTASPAELLKAIYGA